MRLLLVLGSFAAAIGLAAQAQADAAADSQFLTALNHAGITYKSGPEATKSAQQACQLMDQGTSQDAVVKSMTDQNPGFTTDAATKFVQTAENAYCPQHIGGAVQPPTPTTEPTYGFPWFPPPGGAAS
jgi:hypothetical protein